MLGKHFKVDSVCCNKMGGLNKNEHGMNKIKPDQFEIACNPIGQAGKLNRAKTELNIQMGLCLGHDILFLKKYSQAPGAQCWWSRTASWLTIPGEWPTAVTGVANWVKLSGPNLNTLESVRMVVSPEHKSKKGLTTLFKSR
ncbi:MAG: DUF1847 domain-containing protein [Proteobacteria bacterium]|nr:DUF1847 domain-containing protein [Pseudomonadota bacterium]MBU1686854.1 DUF1847 domain-containing protein [Pseudomonadota bacterium]